MNGIVNSLSTMLAGQHARKACAGSLSPHGHARTLEQDRRRTPGRDLDAASGRTAMARQPQPRRSSFRQGAVVSLSSLHRTTIETQIRLSSRAQGAEREAHNSFETHASPGTCRDSRALRWPPAAAHPSTTRPFPSCVPVSEAGTQKGSSQLLQGISGARGIGHGHGHDSRNPARGPEAPIRTPRLTRPPRDQGPQLKSPKNRVPSCLACQSYLDQ